ncbi:hypothetical protein HPB47_026577 [Ixodes persulcatus]|uniref:Uncharacterized protein n=1 Tax=Ixodes persulcatus TaxID=34615 RepID=A0AC60PYU9_IXOPE|nr:hypothetical protein HPB47_026577 [Ixodes persulcatus]
MDWVCESSWKAYVANTVFWVSTAVGVLICGNLSDRVGRVLVIVGVNLLCGGAGLYTFFTEGFLHFVLSRVFLGLVMLALSITPFVLVNFVTDFDYSHRRRTGYVVGRVLVIVGVNLLCGGAGLYTFFTEGFLHFVLSRVFLGLVMLALSITPFVLARASHYQRHPSVTAAALLSGENAPGTDIREIIREVVREEIRRLLPAASRPATLSIAEAVREEVQRAIQPEAPVAVAATEEPTLTYAAVARRPPPPPRTYVAPPRRQSPAPQHDRRHDDPVQYARPEPRAPRKTDVWRTPDRRPLCFHCGEADHTYRRCPYRRLGLRGFHPNDPRPRYGERPREIDEYLRRPQSPEPASRREFRSPSPRRPASPMHRPRLVEYVAPERRMMVLSGFQFSYPLVGAAFPWLAYYIGDWRTLTLVSALPPLAAPLFCLFVPESLRWLVSRGKEARAKKILRFIAKVNGKVLSDEFMGKCRFPAPNESQKPKDSPTDMLKTPNLRKNFLLTLAAWMLACLVYTAGQLYAANASHNPFLMTTAVNAVDIVATATALPLADRWGRRPTMMTTYSLAAFAYLFAVCVPAGVSKDLVQRGTLLGLLSQELPRTYKVVSMH